MITWCLGFHSLLVISIVYVLLTLDIFDFDIFCFLIFGFLVDVITLDEYIVIACGVGLLCWWFLGLSLGGFLMVWRWISVVLACVLACIGLVVPNFG